jgi:hypothetical protein
VVRSKTVATEDLYALKLKAIWRQFWSEHFSFWMICGYLFVEYVRPQSIIPALDILPWGKVFIAGSALGLIVDKNKIWVRDKTNKWMILFLLVITLSSIFAIYPEWSWKSYMDFFIWVIVYFLIINIVNTWQRLFIFILLFLLISFKLSFHGAKTWASRGFAFTEWGLTGPPGYFENSGEFAIQMLMFAPIAYRLAVALKSYLGRAKLVGLMLLPLTAAMSVMGASSRGAQLGLVSQVYATFLRGRLNIKTLAVVGVACWGIYALLPPEQLARFHSAGEDRTSIQRLLYWKHGVEMMEKYPFIGAGFFNFIPYYEANYRDDMLYPTAQLPHNIFVQVGTDTGFSGLFIYLMIIYRGFKVNKETRELMKGKSLLLCELSSGFDAALIGFLIAGQFVTVGYYPFMWINLSFSVATLNIAKRRIEIGSRG